MRSFARIARSIRLVSLDCDGVMTDGRIYYGAEERLVAFHVRDGVGIRRMIRSGLAVAFLSGNSARAIASRAADLGVRHCLTGIELLRTCCVFALYSKCPTRTVAGWLSMAITTNRPSDELFRVYFL